MSETPKIPHYHTILEAIQIHNLVMADGEHPQQGQPLRLGGENILGSALARPQQVAYYEGADVIRQAALLCIAISQAQAFLDGNKRTAFIITEDFLNSAELTIIDSKSIAVKLIEVASGLAENSSPSNREKLETEFEDFLRGSVGYFVDKDFGSSE